MIGYGPEHSNFVLELTYNYGIESYEFGNDLQYLAVQNPAAMARAVALGYPVDEQQCLITGPDNYKVKVLPSISGRAEYFVAVALRSSSLEESQRYWCDLLGMQSLPSLSTALSTAETMKDTANTTLTVGYSAEETALHFIQFHDNQPVNHALSGGRIAFACKSVPEIFQKVSAAGCPVQTPPLTLPTPGKADVVVTILIDPDGYEICFVEDIAFYDLATPKYDVIDWPYRAGKGGDGVPLPRGRQEIPSEEATDAGTKGGVKIIESEEQFEEFLMRSGHTFIAEFNASWCKNCKKISPLIKALAEEHSASLTVLDIDIDDLEDLASTHDASSIPRFIAFRNGSKVDQYVGSSPEEVTTFFQRNCSGA